MTITYKTKDNQCIAYKQSGHGPGLVLLHGGYTQDKSIWSKLSYIQDLKEQFTVVVIDLRGHGESSKPTDMAFYSIDCFIGDIEGIARAVGLKNYLIWGFSLGASIALHCANQLSVKGIVAAGTYFGQELVDYARNNIMGLEEVVRLKRSGQLVESELTQADRYFIDHADLNIALTISKAMAKWPIIEPNEIKIPTLLYSGTNDEPSYSILQGQANKIRAAGINLEFFENFDHFDLINKKPVVFPVVKDFLIDNLAR